MLLKADGVQFQTLTCITCGCLFALASDHVAMLVQEERSFVCPNRHSQHFTRPKPLEDAPERLKAKIEKLEADNRALKLKAFQAIHDAEQAQARGTDESAAAAVAAEKAKETPADETGQRVCPHCGKRYKRYGPCLWRHVRKCEAAKAEKTPERGQKNTGTAPAQV